MIPKAGSGGIREILYGNDLDRRSSLEERKDKSIRADSRAIFLSPDGPHRYPGGLTNPKGLRRGMRGYS